VFVGVDGCSLGWVAIAITDEGFSEARLLDDFDAVVHAFPDARVIGVDMPIGLTEDANRAADRAARSFLKGNASSVFNAPVRSALEAVSYEDAKRISIQVSGKALSKQSYALFGKIREVDAHAGDDRMVEVHPEVSFRTMNGGQPLGRKRSWGGMRARLALLDVAGIALPDALGEVGAAGIDDVVDAAAVAWSARRVAAGAALRFPEEQVIDPVRGRVIAIWA
jgi:predicted RNase H-like nuclease